MKLIALTALIAVCSAAKLDRTYLPPESARTAGGNADILQTPNSHSQESLPKGGFTNEFQGVVVDAVAAGTRSSDPTDSGLGAPRHTYGSQDSKVGNAAFRVANQGNDNQEEQYGLIKGSADTFRTNTRFGTPNFSNNHASASSFAGQGPNFSSQQSGNERSQAAQERSANTLRFESEVGPESFNYAFETDNGISAEETAVATNGVQAQGAFSYTGDDGQVYSITYTADEGGYQPKGEHLPTPPPIPEEILKSLEQNARDEAAGLVDDGSYDAKKYNEGSDYTESSGDNGQYQHGTDEQNGNKGSFSSANAFSRQSSGHSSQIFASAASGQGFNVGNRHGQPSQDVFGQTQGQFNSNSFNSHQAGSQTKGENQYPSRGLINSQGSFNSQASQKQAFSDQTNNQQAFAQSTFGLTNNLNKNNQINNNQQNNGFTKFEATSHQQVRPQDSNSQLFGQHLSTISQTNSFGGQGQNGNSQPFGQASTGHLTDRNANNNNFNNRVNSNVGTLQYNRNIGQSNMQNSGSTVQASSFAGQGQDGNRQAFSQSQFGQTNSIDSTGAPSTNTRFLNNQLNSQQYNQQSRFSQQNSQTQHVGKNINGGNNLGYLPPFGQNTKVVGNLQQRQQITQTGISNQGFAQPQLPLQNFQAKQTQFESISGANRPTNNGVLQQQNTYSSSNKKIEFTQTPSHFANNFAESSAAFGVKKPTTEIKNTHSSFGGNDNIQTQLNNGKLSGFGDVNVNANNNLRPTTTSDLSPKFFTSFNTQQNSGNLNSRFNIPSTESPENNYASSTFGQKSSQFGSSVAPQNTVQNSAQSEADFNIQSSHPTNQFKQKYSLNNVPNSQQNFGQSNQQDFNINGQFDNTFISTTEKPLQNPSVTTSQASFNTQGEIYQYSQPTKAFNSPKAEQSDSQIQINTQSQFGSTPTYQVTPTQQPLANRFSSSNSASGVQNSFSQKFNNQRPFFQAQPQVVAQASAQYQSNKQSAGFQKQTTAFPQQFQPLGQSVASAVFNTGSSQAPSFGSLNPSVSSEPVVANPQQNGEIYEYNKPAQSLPAPNNRDQDGSPSHVSSQSSFSSAGQSFRGTSSQLSASSVSGRGEVFGGPRKPPSFDEHGYHY